MPTAEIPSESSGSGRRYAAFISYSHRDRKWAEWLHRAIENYRIPKNLARADEAGNSQAAALGPIFIDRAELPSSSDLAASVRAALESSAYLIIICSPDAARSRWVNEEIRTFKSLGRASRILCLIVAGNPAGSADDSSSSGQCFPAALRFQLDGEAISNVLAPEPLAADIRPGHDDRNSARLKIIAGLLSVPFDRLRQREHMRRQRRLVMITTASAIGCIAFGVLAAAALLARNEANRQRIVADQQRILADQQSRTARRTADFLKSLFVVSNPSEARGNSITAREVLDRGVQQVGEQLKDEPMVRADLTTTLGDVYTNLGLLKEAEDLLKSAREVPSQPIDAKARESLALGEVQYQRGENDAALVSLQEALRLADSAPVNDPLLRSKILYALGQQYIAGEDYEKARQLFREALSLASSLPESERQVAVARAMQNIAQADFYDKRLDEAAAGFEKALAARLAVSGELHPETVEITDALGSVEYMRGHPAAAERYYRRTLIIERKILGKSDPEIGTTLNNLGRVLLEQRKFTEARPLLKEALDMQLSQRVETDATTLVFTFANLALTNAGLGNYSDAEPLYQKGLTAAVANKHRLRGPILTDLADLQCRTDRVRQGLTLLDEAAPIVAASYPDDPWRTAYLDNVRAGCLTGAKKYLDAARLIESSNPIVLKKWPPATIYGSDAIQRSVRLYNLMGNTEKSEEYVKLAERK